ncbi:MAG: DinB family protein [bacterium]
MSIAQSMLPEFDQEMATTRRVLERVPEGRMDWRPHEKSFPLGSLATHVANLLSWTGITLDGDGFDVNPKDGPNAQPPLCRTTEELVARFDENVAAARAAIAGASDQKMFENWSLRNGGEVAFTLPKVAVLRSFVMNHLIHHRAQLSVYLRLCDVPLPSIYGPTADESPF